MVHVGGQTDMHNFDFFLFIVHVKINSFSNLDCNKLWLYFKNIFAYVYNRKCYGWSVKQKTKLQSVKMGSFEVDNNCKNLRRVLYFFSNAIIKDIYQQQQRIDAQNFR